MAISTSVDKIKALLDECGDDWKKDFSLPEDCMIHWLSDSAEKPYIYEQVRVNLDVDRIHLFYVNEKHSVCGFISAKEQGDKCIINQIQFDQARQGAAEPIFLTNKKLFVDFGNDFCPYDMTAKAIKSKYVFVCGRKTPLTNLII